MAMMGVPTAPGLAAKAKVGSLADAPCGGPDITLVLLGLLPT